MSNWRELLKEAKELFEDGLLDESEYKAEKTRIMAMRSQSTNPGTTTSAAIAPKNDTLMGSTSIGGTGFGNPDDTYDTENDPFASTDTLAGATQFQAVGQTIGSYKVLGELGRGGMGTVYRARHSAEAFAKRTGDVVIKLMNPEVASSPEFADRFIGEAALGRSIKHPNFVDIHDVIVEPHTDTMAIVMDLVEGRPLDKRIPEGGMSVEAALPIIEQLSDALDHIHKQGIIHRDLKPDNIIVQPDGTPIILDMGIAKDTTDSDMSKTSTGVAMGTPLYMAPEQLDAKNATSSVDRYAFGLIVYQMLSGRLPWGDGLGQGEILACKFGGNLEPLSGHPKHVADAVMGLLRASAGDRWDTCAEFMNPFVESEEDRLKREQAERAEQERLERLERERLEAIRLEQEHKSREEAERQRKTEEERLVHEHQERLEAAMDFVTQYPALMEDITAKRAFLKSKLHADIETARTSLNALERDLEQRKKSLTSKLSMDIAIAERPLMQVTDELEKWKRLHEQRESVARKLLEKERELESLDGSWLSFMKGAKSAAIEIEIATLQEELSEIISVVDLDSKVKTTTELYLSLAESLVEEKFRLETDYNDAMRQLKVSILSKIEVLRLTFDSEKKDLEKECALSLRALEEREIKLNEQRQQSESLFANTVVDVIVPTVGESVTEIFEVRILKGVGEYVKEGEVILEGDSDKASIEIVAPTTGHVTEVLATEGEDFPVGDVIARILSDSKALYELELPDVGKDVTEAELVKWYVSVGEIIEPNHVVCEVMTDKATIEINCSVGGTVVEICGDVGNILDVGACLIKLRL